MDDFWSVLFGDYGNYSGPLSIGWGQEDGELIIRIHIPPGTNIDVPDSIRVVVTEDFEIPQAL
jgi:hypothetical protein